MLASGFRQMLSGICKSFASLSLRSQAVHDVNPPLRPNQSNRLRVGTFNVQSLGSHRRQHDTLPRDLKRYKIDIIGLQETKISTLGRKRMGDYTLLTLPATQEKHGIGFAVSARLRPYMWRYWAHTDRIDILQLNLPHTGRINVISAYAPHSGRPLHDVDRFYMDLHDRWILSRGEASRSSLATSTQNLDSDTAAILSWDLTLEEHATATDML